MQTLVVGWVRDALKVVGAYFATRGIIGSDETELWAGTLATLIGLVWSLINRLKARKQAQAQ